MTDTLTIHELTAAWRQAKATEQEAAKQRAQIESEIVKMTALPDKGTTTIATGLKIVTGYTENWSQEAITAAYNEWPADGVAFPFKGEWKADGKAISYLRENAPELYARISPALTLKPSRASFSVKE